jgi:hypothetical protein
MKRIQDAAFVVSVHEEVSPSALRINLRWRGNHEISEFELTRFGKVLNCATETEDTGWVLIGHPRLVSPGEAIPLQSRPSIFCSRLAAW